MSSNHESSKNDEENTIIEYNDDGNNNNNGNNVDNGYRGLDFRSNSEISQFNVFDPFRVQSTNSPQTPSKKSEDLLSSVQLSDKDNFNLDNCNRDNFNINDFNINDFNITNFNMDDFNIGDMRCEIEYDKDQQILDENVSKSFNPIFCTGDTFKILISSEKATIEIDKIFKKFVEEREIDCCRDDSNKNIWDGRIYGKVDEAQFRCQIYSQTENDCILELVRMEGDGFLYHGFRRNFFARISEKNIGEKSMDTNCNMFNDKNSSENFIDFGFIDNDGSNDNFSFSFDSNNDSIISQGLNFDNNSNMNNEMQTKQTIDMKYIKSLMENATNCKYTREIYRDYVATLRQIVNDERDAKVVAEIDNVFELLLAPIVQDEMHALLDCWIIKNILEIISKLIPFSKSKCSKTNIISIKKKWENHVDHPLGIAKFIPSQQICYLCSEIIKVQN